MIIVLRVKKPFPFFFLKNCQGINLRGLSSLTSSFKQQAAAEGASAEESEEQDSKPSSALPGVS